MYVFTVAFNVSFSDSGHIFMSLMVSYLVISRLHNSLNRYMDARRYLSDLMRNSRELMQQTVALTRYGVNSNDRDAKRWRVNVAKRLMTLLRSITSNLQRASTGKNVWEQEGLTEMEVKALLLSVGRSNNRAPFVFNMFLRSVIASHDKQLKKPLEIVQELQLLDFTSSIIHSYVNIMKDLDTPYPFVSFLPKKRVIFIFFCVTHTRLSL